MVRGKEGAGGRDGVQAYLDCWLWNGEGKRDGASWCAVSACGSDMRGGNSVAPAEEGGGRKVAEA